MVEEKSIHLSDISNKMVAADSSNERKTALKSQDREEGSVEFAVSKRTSMEKDSNVAKNGNLNNTTSPKPLDRALIKEILTRVHHNKQSLEDLVEEINDDLEDEFVIGECVVHHGIDYTAKSVEKRGGLVQYVVSDKSGSTQKINARDLKRKVALTEERIRDLINDKTSFDGKNWLVNDDEKEKLDIKDKMAPIFLSPKAKAFERKEQINEDVKGQDFEEEDDEALVVFQQRRISGQPATVNRKSFIKAQEKEKTKNIKKEQKAKEKAEKAKKESKPVKEKKTENLAKFLTPKTKNEPNGGSPSSTSTSSPFLTPQKRSEKRLNSANEKLGAAWKKRDQKEFNEAAAWAAKVLSGVQIDSFSNDLWIFSVRKIFDRTKDKEAMKKMNVKEKEDFKQKMTEKRKVKYQGCEGRLRSYFNAKVLVEDLSVDASKLPVCGTKINGGDVLQRCLVTTQLLISMGKFTHSDEKITAQEMAREIENGIQGFMSCTWKVFEVLLQTLLHDDQYKKYAHFNARLHEFKLDKHTVSELCRAFFIGKTEMSSKADSRAEKHSLKPGKENELIEDETKEEEVEDEENELPDELDTSQTEIELRKKCLHTLTEHKQLWDLSPAEQLDIIEVLQNAIFDLKSYKDYIGMEGLSQEAKQMTERSKKLTSQLESLRGELTELPVYEEVIPMAILSRNETRERNENTRRRENLEKKIEDLSDKQEEIFYKIARERDAQSRAKRVAPIGQDRHFRNYYWFYGSEDAGVWIQDFGKTAYETFVEKCLAQGITDIDTVDPFSLPEIDPGSNALSEVWYHVKDETEINNLIESLNKFGSREGDLKKHLKQNLEDILGSIRLGATKENRSSRSRSPTPEEEDDSTLDYDAHSSIKRTIATLAKDLKDKYFSSIDDVDIFESNLIGATNIEDIKASLIELVDSISPVAILERMTFKEAKEYGAYSILQIPRWKRRVRESQNISALHMLVAYLDSRINWKKSIVDKRCQVCNSLRSPESKIACSDCQMVCHYTCVRPRVHEKPAKWKCVTCSRAEDRRLREEERQNAYGRDSDVDDEDEEEDEEIEENGTADIDDDTFTNEIEVDSDQPKAAKRKRFADIGDDDWQEDEKAGHPKRKTAKTVIYEETSALFESVRKSNPRLFRVLEAIPSGRESRRGPTIKSLEEIEKHLDIYTSFDKFKNEMSAFFKIARSYLEAHNERKVDELDSLVSEFNL